MSSIKRHPNETIDDYLTRFRKLKSRCPTPVPEIELVKMAVKGLDYQVKKKILDHHIVDMAQLADRVRQIESLYAEKMVNRRVIRNQKIAYIDANEPVEFDMDDEEEEVHVAELKPGPPYTCRSLYPNFSKENTIKNDTWGQRTYGFDISKADLIFDILVKDKQISLSEDHQLMTLDQLKGRKYCKFHNKIGHTTNSCIRFRDVIQQAIKDGRLKFESPKAPMKVDADPLSVEANLVEPVAFEINMVQATGDRIHTSSSYVLEQYDRCQREIFPQRGESLIDFLLRKKDEGRDVSLCSRCSALFDQTAADHYKQTDFQRYCDRMISGGRQIISQKYDFLQGKENVEQKQYLKEEDIPDWYRPMRPKAYTNLGLDPEYTKEVQRGQYCPNHQRQVVRPNFRPKYKSRYQWRRNQQRPQKNQNYVPKSEEEVNSLRPLILHQPNGKGKQVVQAEDEESSTKFETGFPDDLQAICNVVSILPLDFSIPVEMVEEENFFDYDEGPMMVPDELKFDSANAAVFPKPTEEMKSHLKPLFIKARAEGKIVKRVLVDGGAAVNLIPEHVVKKLDKSCSDLMPHNMVITDFNGKTSRSPGCIALDLKVGSVTRTTMFVVVPSQANYNLLLGREWIHGVGAVPSTMHQMIFFWDDFGNLEFIKGDEDYFRCEVNNADFDRNLSNIEPLNMPNKEEFYLKYPAQVQLSPTSLCLNRTCDYTLASKIVKDAGVDCTVCEWGYQKISEHPDRPNFSQIVEYNADGTRVNQTTIEKYSQGRNSLSRNPTYWLGE